LREVVIASAARTPIGKFNGNLKNIKVTELGGIVIKEALKKASIDAEQVNEVIMGNILQAGLGQNPARQSAVAAGIPYEIPAMTVNKVCGSGLKSVVSAAQAIMLNDHDIVVAGGMESMSSSQYIIKGARWGNKMGDSKIVDLMIKDGLIDIFNNYHMGVTAENIAEKYNISRKEQDDFAYQSQIKTKKAIQKGRFIDEIVPVEIKTRKGSKLFEQDGFPRLDIKRENLDKLRPAFKKDGTVTAGNSSGINDGAAAVVLLSKEKAKQLNIKPFAVIKGYASYGVDPKFMGIGPIPATKKVLKKTGLKLSDIDLIEANEAFAAQSISVIKELKLNTEIINVNGGAIALGHPIGASGTRILVTLVHEMKKRESELGLATLCIGGGMGISMIVKRN